MWVIADPTDRRVQLLGEAWRRMGLKTVRIVDYRTILAGAETPIPEGSVVRIESPGKDIEINNLICRYGSPEQTVSQLPARGLFGSGAAWFRGFSKILQQLEKQGTKRDWRFINHPQDIAIMFNKPACHERLYQAGIAVPQRLHPVENYQDLREQMEAIGIGRVFIKPSYGSSGAGIIAYAYQRGREQAISTLEYVNSRQLYLSRDIQYHQNNAIIERIINRVCTDGAHVEAWLPKAGYDGHCFDLRVVVIGGKVEQIVVRRSKHPITNLHLLNPRGEIEHARRCVGEAAWKTGVRTCEQVMRHFPNSCYAGIDLMFTPQGKHAVLEVNAFGDLLPGIINEAGDDTYTSELRTFQRTGTDWPS